MNVRRDVRKRHFDPTSGYKGDAATQPHDKAEQTEALLRLLQLEADIRRVNTDKELMFHSVNESRAVLGFRQAFMLRRKSRWRLMAASSVAAFDRNAPLMRSIERLVSNLAAGPEGRGLQSLFLASETMPETLQESSFPHALWLPLRSKHGRVFAGLLLLRETPWPDALFPLAERVSETYAHAWQALLGRSVERRWRVPRKIFAPVFTIGLLAIGLLQAPLTVLAPVEVTARDRAQVSAALPGVIEEVLVASNSSVSAGAILARFDGTELRNAMALADQEMIVARARLEQLQNASFSDRAAAREIKVAEAEYKLAVAEAELARDRVSRIEVRAPTDGLVVMNDAQDLVGKPVSIGELLMEVVNPQNLEFGIRLPANDIIILSEGARVRVFLDSNPLAPVEAELTRHSTRATVQEDGTFAFNLTAKTQEGALEAARLGAQGTAQLFGAEHTIFFIVFRRPISWVRQTFGL